MLTYLTRYLCKSELRMNGKRYGKNMTYGKDIKGKMFSVVNTFLIKCEVSTSEAIKWVLSLPMRHSDIDVPYVPTDLKNNRTGMLKSLSVLEKMHPDNTNVFASSFIGKCEKWPDNLNSMCLADFECSYVHKNTDDLPIEPDEIKSYTVPLSNIDDVKLNTSIIVLKNELGECRNIVNLALFVFTKCPNWKAQKRITWVFYSYICSKEIKMNLSRTTRVMKVDIEVGSSWVI